MKLERRNVYIKEFWSMTFIERYIYCFVNGFYFSKKPVLNPLNWSIKSILYLALYIVISALCPLLCVIEAAALKRRKMPVAKDPEFQGDDWFIEDRWVAKNESN